jgi:hypothetical protein
LAQSSVDERCGSSGSTAEFDSSAAATFSDKVSAGNKWRLNKKTPLASVRPHQNLNLAVDIYSSRMCNNIDEIRGGNALVFLFPFAWSFAAVLELNSKQPTRPSTMNICWPR